MITMAVVTAVLTTGGVPPVAGDEPDRPNVVVIMTDDQTLESLRVMPNVKALIGDAGVTFDQFMVTDALCCPSRATFMSGQYAFHHQVLSNEPPSGGYAAFDHANALPVWLQTAGYRTIHMGKYLNHYSDQPLDVIPPGWDDWQAFFPNGYTNYGVNDNGVLTAYGSAPEDYSTDVLATRAVDAIAESAPGGPFFLNITPFAPHTNAQGVVEPAPRHVGRFAAEPLPSSPAYNESDMSDKPAFMRALPLLKPAAAAEVTSDYRSMLESLLAVDELVDQVMSALAQSGELDNTVVMFTSDNGFHYGEHRIKSGKGRPYEESIRVPLLVSGPGFAPGTTVHELAANIDLAPTIVGLAGATPLRAMDGVDLRTVIANPSTFADRGVLIEGYASSAKTPCFLGVRTLHAAFWSFEGDAEEELYDLDADPRELNSLHADPARAALRADMVARKVALGPRVSPCVVQPPVVGVGDAAAAEGTTEGTVTVAVPVNLDRPLATAVSVPYEVVLGTASSRDVSLATGSVLIGVGKTTAAINVKIKSDAAIEPPETVIVNLLPPADATYAVARSRGTVTILDRGSLAATPAAAVGDVTVTETNVSGTGSVLVTVSLSKASSVPTVLEYSTTAGDAVRSTDFTAATGTVVIAANKLSAWVSLKVSPDVYEEPTESFFIDITAPLGVSADRARGTITILDDDVDP